MSWHSTSPQYYYRFVLHLFFPPADAPSLPLLVHLLLAMTTTVSSDIAAPTAGDYIQALQQCV